MRMIINKNVALVLFFCLCSTGLISTTNAQSKTHNKTNNKTIYKWYDNGLVHYSHIKPVIAKEVIELKSDGRTIEDFTEGFDEVVAITVRPNSVKSGITDSKIRSKKDLAQRSDEANQKQRNCTTAKRNLTMLKGGEVYEKNSVGNMVRLNAEDIAAKLKHVSKDIDYFCSE